MSKYNLILGDSVEHIKNIPEQSVDLILTDPPYNLGRYSTGNIKMSWRKEFNNDVAEWDTAIFNPAEWLDDFVRILTEPNASLTEQYIALLKTEGVDLSFKEDGIRRIAEVAWQVNERTENIGARRLHTLLERLLENISFNATERSGEIQVIDKEYVDQQIADLVKDEDLSRSIL